VTYQGTRNCFSICPLLLISLFNWHQTDRPQDGSPPELLVEGHFGGHGLHSTGGGFGNWLGFTNVISKGGIHGRFNKMLSGHGTECCSLRCRTFCAWGSRNSERVFKILQRPVAQSCTSEEGWVWNLQKQKVTSIQGKKARGLWGRGGGSAKKTSNTAGR